MTKKQHEVARRNLKKAQIKRSSRHTPKFWRVAAEYDTRSNVDELDLIGLTRCRADMDVARYSRQNIRWLVKNRPAAEKLQQKLLAVLDASNAETFAVTITRLT